MEERERAQRSVVLRDLTIVVEWPWMGVGSRAGLGGSRPGRVATPPLEEVVYCVCAVHGETTGGQRCGAQRPTLGICISQKVLLKLFAQRQRNIHYNYTLGAEHFEQTYTLGNRTTL